MRRKQKKTRKISKNRKLTQEEREGIAIRNMNEYTPFRVLKTSIINTVVKKI